MSFHWGLVMGLGATGIVLALLSCLVGMRPKVENPAWWGLYVVWIVVVLAVGVSPPFFTLLAASILAGLLHGTTTELLIDRYIENNSWHAEKMQGPKSKHALKFVLTGLVVGVGMGAVVGGIAWGLSLF
jgi:hypothetical protein